MIKEFRQGFVAYSDNLQTILSDMHVPVQREDTSGGLSQQTMNRAKTFVGKNDSLERQCSTVSPVIFRSKGLDNLKFVRHRTTDFDVWSIISDKKQAKHGKTAPDNTPKNLSRPVSEVSAYEFERRENKKFPILGPTRQQTEIYFKHKKKLQGLSIPGPPADEESLKRINSDTVVNYDKQPENVRHFQKRLRHSWTNITSGSIISRKHKNNATNGDSKENNHDVQFLSELVKPLQYRIRIHEKEEKEKVLFPSKYGFHQRSHSPTFRRLLEATEKLKIISQHETVQSVLKQNTNDNEKKLASLKKPNPEAVQLQTEVFELDPPKTPEISERTDRKKPDIFLTDNTSLYHKDNTTASDFLDDLASDLEEPELEHQNQDIHEEEEDDYEEAEDEVKQESSFKVDFKVAETHAELHLFLPKINSGNKSAKTYKTDDTDSTYKTDRSDPVILPSIKVESNHQIKSYHNPPRKLKRQDTFRKKKRKPVSNPVPVERVKSAADPNKKVRDHLNDVHTLISIQDHHTVHNTDIVCHFENCPYHSLVEQTRN